MIHQVIHRGVNWTVLNLGYDRSWKCCQILCVSFVLVFNVLLFLKPPSPAASTVSMLNDDTTDLIERLADVQQEKWLLEEKVQIIVITRKELALLFIIL